MDTATAIRNKLEFVFDREQAEILSEVITDAYNELVKTSDFNELKAIVKDLAEAQKRTEIKVEELAEAQKRTEIKVEELAEAQKRTEIKVGNLTDRVEELAEAQKRTEIKVEELAEAQIRTEEELHTLIQDHKETRRQLGGLAATVGYTLEDRAYPVLPALLKRDFGIVVKERLKRGYVTDNRGKDSEINVLGKAERNGSQIVIIGESKSQLSKKNVDEFIRRKLKRLTGVFTEEIFPLLITYMISSPDVEEYAKKQGIALYYSYDLLSPASVF